MPAKGVLSEAENFVSAWLDAYKETGDGLDALNEHWDGFFENLVMKKNKNAAFDFYNERTPSLRILHMCYYIVLFLSYFCVR